MTLPNITHNYSLRKHNSLAVDVNAHDFCTIQSVEQLHALQQQQYFEQAPLFLGSGSNILFTQPVNRLVLHNQLQGISITEDNDNHIKLKIASGENWHQLVCYCIEQGYHGIENLALIPGTVGAAPIQNIGAYGVELKDILESVTVFNSKTAEIFELSNFDCQFSYRNSLFKNPNYQHWFITDITLCLTKKPALCLSYPTLKQYLNDNHCPLTAPAIAQAVIAIRQAKLPDPKILPNAGSFFKNPIVNPQQLLQLQHNHPDIPHYTINHNAIKVPAAWLIEACGFKGKRFGDSSMHQQQAVVLINHGTASGEELLALTQQVTAAVKQRFALTLIPEVNIH